MVKLTFKSIKSAYKHCVLEDNRTFYFRFCVNKKFFQELLERYQSRPQKYLEKTPEEIDQDILSQYGRYMQQLQQQKEKPAEETVAVKKQERRQAIEIL